MERLEERALLATIQGALFQDVNENAARDAADTALAQSGVSIFLDANANGLREAGEMATSTDSAGTYAFTGLDAGPYRVVQEVPGGWMQTSPAGAPTNHSFGEVLESFAMPSSNSYAVAWANGFVYVSQFYTDSSIPDRVLKIDPSTGATVSQFELSDPKYLALDLTFDGTDFWAVDWAASGAGDVVFRMDQQGTILSQFPAPGTEPRGIAWDGSSLWVLDNASRRVYHLDTAGQPINDLPGGVNWFGIGGDASQTVNGLAFDGAHLWMGAFDNNFNDVTGHTVVEYDPATALALQSFEVPPSPQGSTLHIRGLAFDGHDFWVNRHDGASNPSQLHKIAAAPFGNRGAAVVTLGAADTAIVDFGNVPVNTLDGNVFNDLNGDGARQSGEPGQQSWRVYVDGNGNGAYDAGEYHLRTNEGGDYRLILRDAGTFSVRVELVDQIWGLPHWAATLPGSGTHTVTFAGTSGGAVSDSDFGTYLDRTFDPLPADWASLGDGGMTNLYTGTSWADTGNTWSWQGGMDWVANSTRNGFDDWKVPTLQEAQAAAINYGIAQAQLPAGGEQVIAAKGGLYWTSTTQGKKAYAVQYDTGQAHSLIVEGSYIFMAMFRDAATMVDDGDGSYTDTGWTKKTSSGAYQGDYRQTGAGNGSRTATWTFSGLEPGATYKLAATWVAGSKLASNAPFTVLDGSTVEGTVLLNQRTAPDDFRVGGTAWEGLGVYTTDSGTLQVTLGNNANGTVVADAVRLFRVYPSFDGTGGTSSASAEGEPILASASSDLSAGEPLFASGLLESPASEPSERLAQPAAAHDRALAADPLRPAALTPLPLGAGTAGQVRSLDLSAVDDYFRSHQESDESDEPWELAVVHGLI